MDFQPHLKYLARTIGPRGPATLGEKAAAAYVKSELEIHRFPASVDLFKTPYSFSYPFILIYSLIPLAAIVYLKNAALALFLALTSLVLYLLEINTVPVISGIFPHGTSQNVIGRLRAREETKHRVVLSAHLDTSKPSLANHPAMVGSFRLSFILMTLSLFAVASIYTLLFMLELFNQGSFLLSGWYLSLPFVAYLLFPIGLMVHREIYFRPTPGANDNASGVAVLLELAASLGSEFLDNTEVWFVFTGGEEAGLFGMQDFIKKYGEELKGAYFINVDNVGGGKVKYIIREGMINTYRADAGLINWAEEVARENQLAASPAVYRLMSLDSLPLLRQGFRAMSLVGIDDRGLIPNWHWESDTVENVNLGSLNEAARLAGGIIRKIDQS